MSEKAIIDLSKITTRADLHRLLKGMLLFPDHYGNNLDALHDILTTRHRVIILSNTANCSDELKEYIPRLIRVFSDCARENNEFFYEVHEGDAPLEDADTSTFD